MIFETAVTDELWQRLRLYFQDLTRLKGDDPDTTVWRYVQEESHENYKVYQGRNLEDEHKKIVIAGSPSLTKIWRITTGATYESKCPLKCL